MQTPYRFAIECCDAAGRVLSREIVTPDFQPALEWAWFEGVRCGALPAVSAPAQGEALPLWCGTRGEPYCRGVRITARSEPDGAAHGGDLPRSWFGELAAAQAAALVSRGSLAPGETWHYELCAHRVDAAAPAAIDVGGALAGLRVEGAPEPLPCAVASLDDFLARSEPDAAGATDGADLAPVFVAARVVCEARARAAAAGALETGGVLLGHLHRDAARREVFAEVSAQVPARHAESRRASFAFTPDTWAAADAARDLRGAGELILGWWHSHPHFCRDCPAERRAHCALSRPFFSPDDVHLHRTCFPQAYQLALLVSDLPPAVPDTSWFGWSVGRVEARPVRVLRDAA